MASSRKSVRRWRGEKRVATHLHDPPAPAGTGQNRLKVGNAELAKIARFGFATHLHDPPHRRTARTGTLAAPQSPLQARTRTLRPHQSRLQAPTGTLPAPSSPASAAQWTLSPPPTSTSAPTRRLPAAPRFNVGANRSSAAASEIDAGADGDFEAPVNTVAGGDGDAEAAAESRAGGGGNPQAGSKIESASDRDAGTTSMIQAAADLSTAHGVVRATREDRGTGAIPGCAGSLPWALDLGSETPKPGVRFGRTPGRLTPTAPAAPPPGTPRPGAGDHSHSARPTPSPPPGAPAPGRPRRTPGAPGSVRGQFASDRVDDGEARWIRSQENKNLYSPGPRPYPQVQALAVHLEQAEGQSDLTRTFSWIRYRNSWDRVVTVPPNGSQRKPLPDSLGTKGSVRCIAVSTGDAPAPGLRMATAEKRNSPGCGIRQSRHEVSWSLSSTTRWSPQLRPCPS